MSNRTCSTCSMCCKLLDVPEVKQPHQWCRHAAPGGGCNIYPDRPLRCRAFTCAWLLDERLDEKWFPARSKIVVDAKMDDQTPVVVFHVDPAYPERWREKPYYQGIKLMARRGLCGMNGRFWQTIVVIGTRRLIVLPNREVAYGPGINVRVGDEFEFIPAHQR